MVDKKIKNSNVSIVNKIRAKKPSSFWNTLPKPFFVLAPMANGTDVAFRSIIAKYGKPDVMWNEFVSADGLNSTGKKRLIHDLQFSKKEKPIVSQLFTGDPVSMKKAVVLCAKLGFDGVDLNMGCPDKTIEKQGSGAAHINDQMNAIHVLKSARQGWISQKKIKIENSEDNINIPISVKTRIGYNRVDLRWIELLLEQKLPALTVHLRTRKEMSDVPAHWEIMPEIVALRDRISPQTHIIGNGDVQNIIDAKKKCDTYGCDGVMIGRGIFGTPWLFEDKEKVRNMKVETQNSQHSNNSDICIDTVQKTPEYRLKVMLEHAKLFEKTFKDIKNFAVMKKHFKAYISGWDGAKELRVKLMETSDFKGVKKIVNEYLKKGGN